MIYYSQKNIWSYKMNLKFSYENAYEEYTKISDFLLKKKYRYSISGSVRRKKDFIGDIDILIEAQNKEEENKILSDIEKYSEIKEKTLEYGIYILNSGIPVQFFFERKEKYIYTLWHSTGSKIHVKNIEKKYLENNLKINEFIGKEEEIYLNLGLNYILPEERID